MIENNIINGKTTDFIEKIPIPAELMNKFQFNTKSEDTCEWITEIVINNELKMRDYIQQLINNSLL
jgi:hypothetical protein